MEIAQFKRLQRLQQFAKEDTTPVGPCEATQVTLGVKAIKKYTATSQLGLSRKPQLQAW